MYNKLQKYIVQQGEYNQYKNCKQSITIKSCESLYCTPITYIILYSDYTSIKKKRLWLTS